MKRFSVPKEAFLQAIWFPLAACWRQQGVSCGVSTHDAADTRSTTHRSRKLRCPYRKNPAQNILSLNVIISEKKFAISLAGLLPWCRIFAEWQPSGTGEQEGWTGAPHRTSVWRGWECHTMEDNSWLQPYLTRCRQGKGSTRTHSSLKKKQSSANPPLWRWVNVHGVWTNPHKNCSYHSMKRGRSSSWSMVELPLPVRDQKT